MAGPVLSLQCSTQALVSFCIFVFFIFFFFYLSLLSSSMFFFFSLLIRRRMRNFSSFHFTRSLRVRSPSSCMSLCLYVNWIRRYNYGFSFRQRIANVFVFWWSVFTSKLMECNCFFIFFFSKVFFSFFYFPLVVHLFTLHHFGLNVRVFLFRWL